MLWASMPEAAIHENNQPFPAECEIGFSQNGQVSPPACNSVLPQQPGECNFRGLVATSANAGHNLGTLCLGENVRHPRIIPTALRGSRSANSTHRCEHGDLLFSLRELASRRTGLSRNFPPSF